jgi:hypothetical protein
LPALLNHRAKENQYKLASRMLRLFIDENFDQDMLCGLRLRLSDLDTITVQVAGLKGVSGRELLDWAVAEHRIFVTHDMSTVPKYAYERVKAAQFMAGFLSSRLCYQSVSQLINSPY